MAEYLNLLPLAAIAGHGEVNGLGDGLWAWYSTSLDSVNVHLQATDTTRTPTDAQAYRQVLQLILSTRSPSRFFGSEAGHDALIGLADSYLPVLADAGIISPELRDAALPLHPERQRYAIASQPESFIARKAANATRIELLRLLSTPALPTLDRGDPSHVEYAVVLYERDSTANVVRLQADTFAGPFDINRGSKLELGSTAPMRSPNWSASCYVMACATRPNALTACTLGQIRRLKRCSRPRLLRPIRCFRQTWRRLHVRR